MKVQQKSNGDGGSDSLNESHSSFGLNDKKPIIGATGTSHWGDEGYSGPLEPSRNLNRTGANENVSTSEVEGGDLPPKKKKFSLPWWCIIVAWILLWLTVAGAVAGVTFYGIMFQVPVTFSLFVVLWL